MSSCLSSNLISNGDFSSGNSGFQSDYSYGLPANGAYLILNANASTINVGWQCVGNTGMYLLGDAYLGANSNKAVWRQTITVMKDSIYLFSFDVNNPIDPSLPGYTDPNIAMKINGTAIYNQTISEVPDKWISMCYMWKATGTSAKLEIIETVGSSSGCDFALDNVFFGQVKEVKKSAFKTVCNNFITLDPAETSTNGYQWDNGPTSKSILVNKAGVYTVRYQNGCNIVKTFTVTKDSAWVKIPIGDTAVCNSINVTAQTSSFISWNNGDTGRVLKVTKPGTYIATVFDACSDMITDTVMVYFRKARLPVFPRDTVLCHKENGILLTMKDSTFRYLINGVSMGSVFVSQSGKYIIQAFDSCNKEFRDTVVVKKDYPLLKILTNDTTICGNIDLVVNVSGEKGSVQWNTSDTGKILHVVNSGLYIATAKNSCNISFNDSVKIYKRKFKLPVFPNDTAICRYETGVSIWLKDQNFTYFINGYKKDTVYAFRDKSYIIQAFDSCDREFRDTFIARTKAVNVNILSKDTTVCNNFDLYVYSNVRPIFWNTGDTGNLIKITQSGLYIARASNICEMKSDSITVYFIKPGEPVFPNDTILCRPDIGVTIKLVNSAYKYKIDGINTNSSFIYKTGAHILQAFDACNTEYRDTFKLRIREQPVFGLPSILSICKSTEETLNILPGFKSIMWSNGQSSNSIKVSQDGIIWVNATDSCGNIYTDTVVVQTKECSNNGNTGGGLCYVNIPNAFSPNDNNLNDKFYPVFTCPVQYLDFKIFNRWGEMIFYSNDHGAQWDGTYNGEVCELGVYLYLITAGTWTGTYTKNFYEAGTFELLR